MHRGVIPCVTFALLVGNYMSAQNQPVEVRYEPSDRLSVEWGEGMRANFDSLVSKHPQLESGRRFAVVVTNQAESPVLAIVVRWKWVDSHGRPSIHDVRSDSLYLNDSPVLSPHRRMILLPGLVVAESNSGFGMSGLPLAEGLRQFEGASGISASIDCVIFGDGRFLGPDESGMIESLHVRKRVASEFGHVVLRAIALGQDPSAVSKRYLRDYAGIGSRSEQLWRQRLANLIISSSGPVAGLEPKSPLAAARSPESLARRFANLPEIPTPLR